jgi:hypothetical protein
LARVVAKLGTARRARNQSVAPAPRNGDAATGGRDCVARV